MFWPLMKFSTEHHFSYITTHTDGHKKQLQSYYKLTEEELEEITKEWLVDFLIPYNPMELSNVDSLKVAQDTPRSSKTKKPVEVQDIENTYMRTASISPNEGGDRKDIKGAKIEQQKGEVPPPRDEEDSLKKRKVSPPKSSSRKKPITPVTKMQTTLTLDGFNFIIAAVNDASQEILENQEVKQEQMYNYIEIELQGVQQALQSSHAVSTSPPTAGIVELGDEPAQLH
jgi:hypothetical protein